MEKSLTEELCSYPMLICVHYFRKFLSLAHFEKHFEKHFESTVRLLRFHPGFYSKPKMSVDKE